jgi:tetratricopeptide (TPR) repeat protein
MIVGAEKKGLSVAHKTYMQTKCTAPTLVLTAFLVISPIELASTQTTWATPSRAPKTQVPPSSSHRFEQISKRAAEARDQNKSDDAIRLYREALKLEPSWLEGWWDLGVILYEADRYEEARNAFRRLASLKPEGGPGWAMLGLCEFELRDYEHALRHLGRAQAIGVGSNPELNSVAQYHAAVLYTRFEEYEAGIKTLFTMAQKGNETPSLIEALGLGVLRMPFLPSEMPPDKREMVLMAGRAAYDMRMRRPADGQREFEELLTRYPETPNVHYAYGTFLLNTDSDAALREFNREIQISPRHVPALLQIAFEDIKRADFAAGLPFAEKAVDSAPQLFAAHDALGRILLGMGGTTQAISELETAVKLAPDSPEVCFALSTAYARAGRKEDAARLRAEFTRLNSLRKN